MDTPLQFVVGKVADSGIRVFRGLHPQQFSFKDSMTVSVFREVCAISYAVFAVIFGLLMRPRSRCAFTKQVLSCIQIAHVVRQDTTS